MLENIGKVFSNKQRSEAVKLVISNNIKVAIFDDGFQDPGIKSDISIICFNEKQWIGNGFVIPSGPLRENLSSLKKYDAVFLNGNGEEKNIDEIDENDMILDIGSKTISSIETTINKSKTVLWNGPAGYFENPNFHLWIHLAVTSDCGAHSSRLILALAGFPRRPQSIITLGYDYMSC